MYFADVQRIFTRVQHHMHKRTKKGYIPLKTCQRKCGKKCNVTCKSDFPKSTVCIRKSLLVCRGVARKHKLKLTGRRNAFASILGERTCEWQSGTTPAFAVAFFSNTHYPTGEFLQSLSAIQMTFAKAPNAKQRLEIPGTSRFPANLLNVCNDSAQDTIAATVSSHNQLAASIWQELQSLCRTSTRV